MQGEELDYELKKCHFMVKKEIVIGRVIPPDRIDVDKAKVELIANLLPSLV